MKSDARFHELAVKEALGKISIPELAELEQLSKARRPKRTKQELRATANHNRKVDRLLAKLVAATGMRRISFWPARPWRDGELLIRLRERLNARKAAVLAASLLLAGCSFTTGTRTAPDGSQLAVHNSRFLQASEGISFGVEDTNGFKVNLSVNKSRPDVEAIQAVAQGVAAGLAQGAKP